MIFSKQQSVDFIMTLKNKKHIQQSLTAFIAELSRHLALPVNVVNSGSKRIYESLINDVPGDANNTLTTDSIQISVNSISIDSKDNTAPHPINVVLKSGNMPHLFAITAMQKRVTVSIDCVYKSANSLDALDATEYIIDNLTVQRHFKFNVLGNQHTGSYSLTSEDFDKDVNKAFDYSDTTNGVDINFSLELEVPYYAIQTGLLINFINNNTVNDFVDALNDYNDSFDYETGGTPTLIDDTKIVKYIGVINITSDTNDSYDTMIIASDNVTNEDLDKTHIDKELL